MYPFYVVRSVSKKIPPRSATNLCLVFQLHCLNFNMDMNVNILDCWLVLLRNGKCKFLACVNLGMFFILVRKWYPPSLSSSTIHRYLFRTQTFKLHFPFILHQFYAFILRFLLSVFLFHNSSLSVGLFHVLPQLTFADIAGGRRSYGVFSKI
jgi:hypothetical protein